MLRSKYGYFKFVASFSSFQCISTKKSKHEKNNSLSKQY